MNNISNYIKNLTPAEVKSKSLLSWLTFGLLLFGHYIYGWRGNLAAILTLTAFITLAIGYFGSRFVIEIIL